jgi:Ribbon-helix-helix protein, copG family
MKPLTIRLPDALITQIEAESRRRKISKSDIVRERLAEGARLTQLRPPALDAIADLIGSIDELPADLSASKKSYLQSSGYGRKRSR